MNVSESDSCNDFLNTSEDCEGIFLPEIKRPDRQSLVPGKALPLLKKMLPIHAKSNFEI